MSQQDIMNNCPAPRELSSRRKSSQRDFFSSYVPQLENFIRSGLDDNWEDPTIDLQEIEVRQPSPIQSRQSSNNIADQTLGELECLVEQLKKKNRYSDKLITILLSGLQKTLGQHTYQAFVQGKLPPTWMPIVKMNDINCPYIEFLVKSDHAEEDPESQLNNYSNQHLAYSKYILDNLYEIAKKPVAKSMHSAGSTSVNLMQSTPKRQPTTTVNTKIPSNGNSSGLNLNDSRRIQPARACRASMPSKSRSIR